MALSSDMKETQRPVLSWDNFSFEENSTAVMSDAYKFIIPVPAQQEGSEPLVYPEGHAQAGQPIVDYKNRPIGDWGLVFFNAKDQAYQAVAADGDGVIILNGVTSAQAQKIDEKVRSMVSNPEELTIEQIKSLLSFVRTTVGIDDIYNSTRAYVCEKLVAVSAGENLEPPSNGLCYGGRKRRNEDISQAIYVPGTFALKGVTASEQLFDNGGVVVNQDGELWGIQPETFLSTYSLANGNSINTLEGDIATFNIEPNIEPIIKS